MEAKVSDVQPVDTDSAFTEEDVCHQCGIGTGTESKDGYAEGTPVQESEIWVGFMHQSRHFIGRVQSPSTTAMKLYQVRAWWENRVPSFHRIVHTIILCQRPTILIGLIPPVCKVFLFSAVGLR